MKKMLTLLMLMLPTSTLALEIGDVVYIKSGGRAMTVTSKPTIGGSGVQEVVVQWDTGSGMTSATLPEDALVTNDPRPSLDRAAATRAAREALTAVPADK